MTLRKAGVIIIGDEILKGRVQDANSQFITAELLKVGVQTDRICTVPDIVDCIASEVTQYARKYQYVITTGGVGPTHDDITLEAIAKGFNEKLKLNKEIAEYLTERGMRREDAVNNKMAHIPETAKVYFGTTNKLREYFPLIVLRNVYILPGIPEYARVGLLENIHLFTDTDSPALYSRRIYYNVGDEVMLAGPLEVIANKYKHTVSIGCYPVTDRYYSVMLTLDSTDQQALLECYNTITTTLLPDNQVTCGGEKQVNDVVHKLTNEMLTKIENSMKTIGKAVTIYDDDEMCIAFNGGKDCTVLLHLIKTYFEKIHQKNRFEKIKLLYLKNKNNFKDVESFVLQTCKEFKLEIITIENENCLKKSLTKFKELYPKYEAIQMGTRFIDPWANNLHSFQTTDAHWPHYMRVLPILDWGYGDVWKYLQETGVSYCALYDEGYTSIGESTNTVPNPALLNGASYMPAYMLTDETKERDSRI